MIWKLLRKNISIWQIAGYAIATFVGLTIVICALRFYGDVSAIFDADSSASSSVISKDYMVVSKPVSMLNTLGAATTGFTDKDIDEIASQPWAIKVGQFMSANFNVAASVDFQGRGMSTYLFLEAIPDEFLDVTPKGWGFDPQDPEAAPIPIIISKDYIALYNFGFASTRGLPQLSEGLISKVPLTLYVSGNGRVDSFPARIVGFSSRLNTIAVPEAFVAWANQRYAPNKAEAPSRLIVEVSSPGDPAVADFFKRHGYEVAGDKLSGGKAAFFLTLITTIVAVVGVVIAALALFVLMLSIFLLLQKNREKLRDLMLLGYSPAQVSACYYRLVGIVNVVVLVLSVAAMFVCSGLWQAQLRQLDIKPGSPWPAVVTAVVLIAVITAAAFAAIALRVRRSFRS